MAINVLADTSSKIPFSVSEVNIFVLTYENTGKMMGSKNKKNKQKHMYLKSVCNRTLL